MRGILRTCILDNYPGSFDKINGTYPLLLMAIDETPESVMLRVKMSDPVSAFHTFARRKQDY